MISAIIIDDYQDHRNDLRLLLQQYPQITLLAECSSGFEGIDAILKFKPQLIFLDVEMPGMSGFEMLEQIEDKHFDIIFTTAHSQYAMNAIDIACLHYLTKPLTQEKLDLAINRFYAEQGKRETLRQYDLLLQNLKAIDYKSQRLAIPDQSGARYFFNINTIVFCTSAGVEDSSGAYTIFHFIHGEKKVGSRSLKHYETLLKPFGFERSDRAYLINLAFVKSIINKNGSEIAIEHYPNEKIPLARRRKEAFEARLNSL